MSKATLLDVIVDKGVEGTSRKNSRDAEGSSIFAFGFPNRLRGVNTSPSSKSVDGFVVIGVPLNEGFADSYPAPV
jgi:hypothetical protein